MKLKGLQIETTKIGEGAQVERLAAAVVNQAVKDLLMGNPLQQITALEFLLSPDFALWAGAAGSDLLNPRIVLREPERVRKLILKGK